MSAIKFSKQMRQPNHKEIDYWVDYNSDPYGGKIKYHNGTDWVDLVNANGGSVNLSDYFNKSQINSMLVGKASQESVDDKADKKDVNDLIKNIEILKLEEGVNLIIFKYDGTNVAVSLPIADSTQSGIVTAEDFENFVKQHQLQSLYSEMYDKLAEIRSEYQKKLKAGRNIVIDDDNTIHSESDIIVEWDSIENKPQFHEVATSGDYNDLLNTPDNKISTLQQSLTNEVNRATAAELTLSSRIDNHFDVTNILIEQKADKSDTYTKDLINEKLSGVYKIQGSCTFEKLPAVDNIVGDVYNITNVFTLDGTEYPIGTNVVWTENGWDALAGIFDSSELEESINAVDQSLSQEKIRAIGAEQANTGLISRERNRAIAAEEQLLTNIDIVDGKLVNYLPLTGGTLNGSIVMGKNTYIYGEEQANGQAIVFFSGGKTILGSVGELTTAAPHIRSITGHATIGTATAAQYTIWDSGNDGPGSGLNADLLDGMQPSELSVNSATKLTVNYLHSLSAERLIYKKFASITIEKRYVGYTSLLLLQTSLSSNNGYGNSCRVYVNCYQQNAIGEAPFYSLKTDCDDRYFSIYGVVNYSSSESTLDLYVYGKNRNYVSMSVSLLLGNNIISIGDTVLSELPSGTVVTPEKMGSVYTATKLQTPVSLWGLSFDGTGNVSGNLTLPNDSAIITTDSNGNVLPVLKTTTSNSLAIGYGAAINDYATIIYGKNIRLRYGRDISDGLFLNSSGNVTIGSSDLATTNYKLYVKGKVNITDLITSGELVDWYGVSWSEDSSDPTCTRIGNMALHRSLPILSAMKGYVINNSSNKSLSNEVIVPIKNDWSAVEFSFLSNGQSDTGFTSPTSLVMVKIPEFWYIDDYDGVTKTHNLKISQTTKAGWCHHKEAYVSAYEGYSDGTYYRSTKGQIPTVSATRTALRTLARANGYEGEYKWNIYTYEEHRAICHLFLVEYATRNSLLAVNTELTADGFKQGGLGSGCTTATALVNGVTTYAFVPTGITDSLGNGSGQVAYTHTNTDAAGNSGTLTVYANRYRGIENPFGHIWKHCDDVITQYFTSSACRTAYKCNKPEHFATEKNTKYKPLCAFPGGGEGYLKEIKATVNCDFFPMTKTGASSTTYWCDYNYDNTDTTEHCVLLGGSSANGRGQAGLFCVSTTSDVDRSNTHIGSRLTYLPWAE